MHRNATRRAAPSPRKNTKKYVIALVVVLLLAGGALGAKHYLTKDDATPVSKIDMSPAKPADNAANEDRKNDPATPSQQDDKGGQTLNNTNGQAPFSVSITGANVDRNNNTLYVGSIVNGATAGTCTLMLTKDGASTITKTAQVTLQNNAYVCPTFSVPASSMTPTGAWQATLTVTNEGATASDKTDVTV